METDKQRKKRIYDENLKAMNVKMWGFGLDDIQVVVDQCGCTKNKANKALTKSKGNLARAIRLITNEEI